MKLLVLGASGRTGLHVVQQALERGDEVTALVRNPATFSAPPNVRVVQGDVSDAMAMKKAVSGQDAVISVFGPRIRTDGSSQSVGTQNLVKVMAQAGARRLVLMSSIGVGDSRFQPPVYVRLIFKSWLRRVFQDKERQEAIVTGSALDWTLVRPVHLTDGASKGPASVVKADDRNVTFSVPRVDVAKVLLEVVRAPSTIHEKLTVFSGEIR